MNYLEYDTIYLFTAIGSPHRVFVEEYEGKRLFGITIRYLFTTVGFPHRVFVEE
jgi:hypothetical protein